MDVGLQLFFPSHGWPGTTDSQVFAEELRLALLAEELGFDVIWVVEHHFFDYSFCPDNMQLLSYLAAKTQRIDLGTAAVIMPWNDPLRVAEKMSMLDELSGGRARLGMGRGLSRREYAGFSTTAMDESRERFDEGSELVIRALETGFAEGDGPHYPQQRVAIRPAPTRSFADRLYTVASSDDSIDSAARLAGRMVMFADKPWEKRLPSIQRWRTLFADYHGVQAPPPMTCDFTYLHPDAELASSRGKQYLATYLESIVEHYEIMGTHFADTKGYGAYASAAESLQAIGAEGLLKGFTKAAAHGTPDQVLQQLSDRRELIGEFELCTAFRFGGIPIAEAEASMRLFASEVLPVLHSWVSQGAGATLVA
jgi:alkanesulfonate monooxygenase SsuD/methylene tetrahydromethanopterin reductase-like flavin-dependent oxidoreductase (luciferase family)